MAQSLENVLVFFLNYRDLLGKVIEGHQKNPIIIVSFGWPGDQCPLCFLLFSPLTL
jgi:hypothetical protein